MYPNRDLRRLLLPLIAEQPLTALMGIADTLMVSNVSAEALSGVSLADTVNHLIIPVFSAMAAGGTIVCAQYPGRGNPTDARRTAGQVLLSCTALSVIPALRCHAGSAALDRCRCLDAKYSYHQPHHPGKEQP